MYKNYIFDLYGTLIDINTDPTLVEYVYEFTDQNRPKRALGLSEGFFPQKFLSK